MGNIQFYRSNTNAIIYSEIGAAYNILLLIKFYPNETAA